MKFYSLSSTEACDTVRDLKIKECCCHYETYMIAEAETKIKSNEYIINQVIIKTIKKIWHGNENDKNGDRENDSKKKKGCSKHKVCTTIR